MNARFVYFHFYLVHIIFSLSCNLSSNNINHNHYNMISDQNKKFNA